MNHPTAKTGKPIFKEIGKLKNGTHFIYNGIEFKITKSGFGTGTNVLVEFETVNDHEGGAYCLPKYTSVKVGIEHQ